MNTIKARVNFPCKFHYGDEPDAWQAWFDDTSWEDVTLPHDWSVHMPFSKEYSSGTGYLAGGIGWYRIHIKGNPEWIGKNISITFDGVYKNSRVWCNSYYLGERPNGYISFTYDMTDFFNFKGENVISVYVDRREISDSRWFTGSGIIGKVYLTIEEKIHPSNYGIFFSTPVANNNLCIWKIDGKWVNNTEEDAKINVIYKLINEEGTCVDKTTSTMVILSKDEIEHSISSTLNNPTLWSCDNPYLYTLIAEVDNGKETYEVYREKVGVRSFKFDANNGFFLNDVPTTFKGVCLHHDAGALGAAVPPFVWYERLKKLKDMGCNAIRMSHNPHVPELYYLCDSLGFMVMDEAFDEWEGPKNKWWQGHNVYPPKNQGYYVNFHTWGKKDLTDMVLRDRNHPSVIMWSTGNEIDYPNDPYCNATFKTMTGNNDKNKPANERIYNPLRPDSKRLKYLSKMLTDVVKEIDDTHPVTLAASFPELSASIGFIDSLDVVGYNYRENLYEEHHKLYPDKPFIGSENGHSYAQWHAVTDNDYISGQFLWTGIDYLGEARGWPIRGAMSGLLTTANYEKPGYYRRKSFWSDKPYVSMVTIPASDSTKTAWGDEFENAIDCEFSPVERTWNYDVGDEIVVKCYTNADKVELLLNGKSIDIKEKNNSKDCVLFTLPFKEGILEAISYQKNNICACDKLITTGNTTDIRITKQQVIKELLPLIPVFDVNAIDAFDDVERYNIELIDRNDNLVIFEDKEICVEITDGSIIGIDNGDLSDVTDYSSRIRKTYKGKLAVYAIRDKKDIDPQLKVTVKS